MNAQTRASMVRGQRNAQRTWDYIRSNPGVDTATIEGALCISRSTLNRYLAEFLQMGMIREVIVRNDNHIRIRHFTALLKKPYEQTPHYQEIPPVDTTERKAPEHHWSEYKPGQRWYRVWRDADKLAHPEDYKHG